MPTLIPRRDVRNVAIVAHVDHGKTTLVDALLRQAGLFRRHETVPDRVLDSLDLERERGITILAKNTSIRHGGVKVNVVDTPGHADFGGEVERTLALVDGVLLLVDAAEGVLPQTRFVVAHALERRLPMIVVVNKVDRKDARPAEVLEEVWELFLDLGGDDGLLDAPTFFTNARAGTCRASPEGVDSDLRPLLDAVVARIPAPRHDPARPLQVIVTNLDHSDYVGRLAVGRVVSGRLQRGERIARLDADGGVHAGKLVALFQFEGLDRVECEAASAGDLVAVAGLPDVEVGDTIGDPESPAPLPRVAVERPTLSMTFHVNASPLAGREGRHVTARVLGDRLRREALTDVALQVEPTSAPDVFEVSGRGELQLAILVETMRREGLEFAVGKPRVLVQDDGDGPQEPHEELLVDVPEEHVGVVNQLLGPRRAQLQAVRELGASRVRLEFLVPSRGLIGFRGDFLTATRGTGVLNRRFVGYRSWAGSIPGRTSGALVADRPGRVTSHAVEQLQDRGRLFVAPGREVYEGMVCGEHCREGDLDVNACRERKLTNMRSSTAEIATKVAPPRILSLDESLAFIAEDELLEVTPQSLRLRKRVLGATDRRVQAKREAAAGR